MKGRVAYVSGPMSGLPGHNYDAFAEAAHWLRQNLCENVVSPHEIWCDESAGYPQDSTADDWVKHMRADIAALMECDTIVLIPGWPRSRGSRLELTIAMELGMDVWFYDALKSPRLTPTVTGPLAP